MKLSKLEAYLMSHDFHVRPVDTDKVGESVEVVCHAARVGELLELMERNYNNFDIHYSHRKTPFGGNIANVRCVVDLPVRAFLT